MSIRPSASLAKTRVLHGQVYRSLSYAFYNYYCCCCCCCCCYFCCPLFIPLLRHRNHSIEKVQNREIQIILRSFLPKFIEFVWRRPCWCTQLYHKEMITGWKVIFLVLMRSNSTFVVWLLAGHGLQHQRPCVDLKISHQCISLGPLPRTGQVFFFFLFVRFIGTNPNAPITTGITFVITSYIFQTSFARSWYFSTISLPFFSPVHSLELPHL